MSWPIGIAMGRVGHEWLAASFGWPMAFTAVSSVCTVAAGAISLGYRAPNLARPAAVTVTVHILTRPEFMLTLLAGHRPGVGAAFIFEPLYLRR